MSDYPQTTCLSSEQHDDNISNHMLHYLGCIKVGERAAFFDVSHYVWEKEFERERERERKRNRLKDNEPQMDQRSPVKSRVEEKISKWKNECVRNMERFDHIRKALARSQDEKHVVHNFQESLRNWRASDEYEKGVELIARSGINPLPCYPPPKPPPGTDQSSTPASASVDRSDEGEVRNNTAQAQTPASEPAEENYDPEEDLNVHIILYEDSESIPKDEFEARGCESNDQPPAKVSKLKKELETTNVATILKLAKKYEETPNRLSELRLTESLSYVHFPANNMSWIERALGLYYGQDPPNFDSVNRELQEPYKTDTYMMLRPQYWRGQMHGSAGSAPHSRHMRPMCEAVSSNPNSMSQTPRNMVLFMPYLHWETDRLRNKFALEMDILADEWFENRQQKEQKRREERIKARKAIHPDIPGLPPSTAPDIRPKRNQTIGSVADGSNSARVQKGLRIEKNGRVTISDENPKRKLGQLLLDAARLYEAMSTCRDRNLLKKYLYFDPPLHPRRTLDQAYYWTLNTSKSRDRDQVVYRATTAKAQDFHTFVNGGWLEHNGLVETPCRSCTAGIRKVSRVMMVDQLWMWILDEKTIITSFPKRYGTQKYDHSGVHKAIRTKLDRARPNQIRSVFDLGLLVIDECSNTFFDRARKNDRQPQVIDQFSEAIGNVSRDETAAFERLYKWTNNASKIYRRPGNIEMSELHVPLLDINPEAALHREIEDIKEELEIMIYVVRSHHFVLESFINHVKHMLDGDSLFDTSGATPGQNTTSPTPNAMQARPPAVYNNPEARQHIFRFFELNAKEVQTKIKWRIKELEQLRDSAMSTCEGVKGLLALKQQQAGVVQAWMSLKQSEETVRQGRSIMLFTVVTIVFLPLTFTAAIFGMNAMELGADGSLKLAEEFAVMFPISIVIITITLAIAFSTWIRTFLWSIWHVAWFGIVTKTPIYNSWLDMGLTSDSVYKHAISVTSKLKDQVRDARRSRRMEERGRQGVKAGTSQEAKSSDVPGKDPSVRAEHSEGDTTATATRNGTAHNETTKRRSWWRPGMFNTTAGKGLLPRYANGAPSGR